MQEACIEALAVQLLHNNLSQPFDLSLINLGVSNFHEQDTAQGKLSIANIFGGNSGAGPVKAATMQPSPALGEIAAQLPTHATAMHTCDGCDVTSEQHSMGSVLKPNGLVALPGSDRSVSIGMLFVTCLHHMEWVALAQQSLSPKSVPCTIFMLHSCSRSCFHSHCLLMLFQHSCCWRDYKATC
jgi:hypothetical protein